MLVFVIIGIILCVALYFLFQWVWDHIVEYANDAAGGAASGFGGLTDFFDIFRGLDGIDMPSLPGQ
jgi:hypothetical protein